MAAAAFVTARRGLREAEDMPGVLKTNRGPIVSTPSTLSLLIRLFFAEGSETLSIPTEFSLFLSSGDRNGFVIIIEASSHGVQFCVTSMWETRARRERV